MPQRKQAPKLPPNEPGVLVIPDPGGRGYWSLRWVHETQCITVWRTTPEGGRERTCHVPLPTFLKSLLSLLY